jgi:hypothetical protein
MPRSFPTVPAPSVEIADTARRAERHWLTFFYDLMAALKNRAPVTGSVTFAAATTQAVTFDTAEADANYDIWYASPEDNFLWTTSKATTGFTANAKNSSSATFRWQLIRA